jgi:plastocyanin
VTIEGNWDVQRPDPTRVVVYLASTPTLDELASDLPFATVAQKNKAFAPNFTIVPRGTTVEFPNWDDFDHNVFSRSKAAPAFDLERYPRGQSKSRVFEKVGVVQVFCNIHPQMRAIIYVTPNRYFARADAEGRFEIQGVPPGEYEVVTWHERCSEQRGKVDLREGAAEIDLTLQDSRQQIIANEAGRNDRGYGVERGLGVKREKLDLPVVEDSHPARSAPPR